MEKSYIERDALKRVYMGKGKDKLRLATVINELELAPAADVVEVVRCKDCVYSKNYNCTRGEMYDDTSYRPDYFCADGERRE